MAPTQPQYYHDRMFSGLLAIDESLPPECKPVGKQHRTHFKNVKRRSIHNPKVFWKGVRQANHATAQCRDSRTESQLSQLWHPASADPVPADIPDSQTSEEELNSDSLCGSFLSLTEIAELTYGKPPIQQRRLHMQIRRNCRWSLECINSEWKQHPVHSMLEERRKVRTEQFQARCQAAQKQRLARIQAKKHARELQLKQN